jgi:hypothetical protein
MYVLHAWLFRLKRSGYSSSYRLGVTGVPSLDLVGILLQVLGFEWAFKVCLLRQQLLGLSHGRQWPKKLLPSAAERHRHVIT